MLFTVMLISLSYYKLVDAIEHHLQRQATWRTIGRQPVRHLRVQEPINCSNNGHTQILFSQQHVNLFLIKSSARCLYLQEHVLSRPSLSSISIPIIRNIHQIKNKILTYCISTYKHVHFLFKFIINGILSSMCSIICN